MTITVSATSRPRILIVDDNEAIHEDFRKVLEGAGHAAATLDEAEAALFGQVVTSEPQTRSYELNFARQGQDALQLVCDAVRSRRPYAVAFVDVRMPPGWDGVESIAHFWQVDPNLEIVLCTAYSDYTWADVTGRLGRADHIFTLKKPFEPLTVRQLACALVEKRELVEQGLHKARKLERSRERYRLLFEQSRDAIIALDRELHFVDANAAALALFACERRIDLLGSDIQDRFVYPAECMAFVKGLEAAGGVADFEARLRRQDEKVAQCLLTVGGRRSQRGRPREFYGVIRDVTEAKHTAAQLRQKEEQLQFAQRMETVGTLATGVAHEFNNLLQAVVGRTGLVMDTLPKDSRAYADLEDVIKACQRGATLTSQLMTYGRRRLVRRKAIDLNEVVRDVANLIEYLVGEGIEMAIGGEPDPVIVQADPDLMSQVLMNLALNARDAMPGGGRLAMQTQRFVFDDAYCEVHPEAKPGPYGCLLVTDTGIGMTRDVLDRIFDPFFTTKEVGKGTGLGLSTAYSIVKQHQGTIYAYSEPGMGSTFKVYLPAGKGEEYQPAPASIATTAAAAAAPGARGTETILVAEDDPAVRDVLSRVLGGAGYVVLAAEDGQEAVELFEANAARISLVLLDSGLPKLMGADVYERIKVIRPQVPTLFCSGYGDLADRVGKLRGQPVRFIAKPIDPRGLLRTVREMLDGAAAPLMTKA